MANARPFLKKGSLKGGGTAGVEIHFGTHRSMIRPRAPLGSPDGDVFGAAEIPNIPPAALPDKIAVLDQDISASKIILALSKHLGQEYIRFGSWVSILSGPVQSISFIMDQDLIKPTLDTFPCPQEGPPAGYREGGTPRGIPSGRYPQGGTGDTPKEFLGTPGHSPRLRKAQEASL